MIEDYVKNTHASTHNQYKMKVMDVFAVNKDRENKQFNDVGNRYVGGSKNPLPSRNYIISYCTGYIKCLTNLKMYEEELQEN